MSAQPRPQAPPSGPQSRPSSGSMPPQPTSILQKQSSFSKKSGNVQPSPKAAGAPPQPAPQAPPPQQQVPPPQMPPPQQAPVAAGAPPGAPMARPVPATSPAAKQMAPPAATSPAKGPLPAQSPAMAGGANARAAPPPPGMWGPNGELAGAARPVAGGAQGPYTMTGADNKAPAAQPPAAMRGPAPAGAARKAPPAQSPATGGARGAAVPTQQPPQQPPAAGRPNPPAGYPAPGGVQRQGSFGPQPGGSQFGSMGPGQMSQGGQQPSAFGSMRGGNMQSGYGSMGPGTMDQAGTMGPQGYGSMGGANAMTPGSMGPNGYGSMGPGTMGNMQGYGSMNQNAMGGYGSMANGGMMGSMGPNQYGSMGPGPNGMGGSMYGGSMMGGNSLFGSQFGSMGPGAMGGAGSLYGAPGVNPSTSAYGFAAQWGSLANMSAAPDRSGISRSDITSEYGGFGAEAKGYRMEDLCPNIGTLEEGKTVKRSGRRGGNHLYNRDKNDRSAPVVTSNSKANAMTIKRKPSTEAIKKDGAKSGEGAGSSGAAARTPGQASSSSASRGIAATDRKASTTKDGKQRAKLPGNYDLHTLLVIDQAASGKGVQVRDPNAVVFEKDGKKETFETDEAILREKATDEVDSVLLSSVLTSWHGGHNSSLLVGAGKGKAKESVKLACDFVKNAVERLEKTASANYFDINLNMCAIRGANQGCDLLKGDGSYSKLKLGSSPVYGPCLLDLETKVVKSSKECVKFLEDGVAAAKEEKEIIVAFLVLKQSKKGTGEKEVRLSSLCIALVREELSLLIDVKEKSSNSPHQLFRYAVGGASVGVSALVIGSDDETARSCLDVERKMREVKNRAPRSGNLQKFIEYTEKEITRMKEKIANAPESEKKRNESQLKKMEEMVKDTQKVFDDPENEQPIGYLLP